MNYLNPSTEDTGKSVERVISISTIGPNPFLLVVLVNI